MKKQSSIVNPKGIIECPVCGEKEVVDEKASGKVSHKCKCGHLIESDYDNMTAVEIRPTRGVTRQFEPAMPTV